MNTPPPPPPPPAQDTDHPEAPAKPKPAWSKPTIMKMSYVNVVASGSHLIDADEERVKYLAPS